VKVILDSLKYLQKDVGLKVYAFVVLENHLHLVVQSENIAKDMARFKSFTARNIIDYLKLNNAKSILDQLNFYKKYHKQDREFQLWQEGMQPKQIQNAEMMKERINYIHNNPVKRGYVDKPKHWRYCSARIYEGYQGLLDIEVVDGF
jgi:REP element-mobilizing transposase RayT